MVRGLTLRDACKLAAAAAALALPGACTRDWDRHDPRLGSCASVEGAYTITLNEFASSAECTPEFPSMQCLVLQEGCHIIWSCDVGDYFLEGELNEDNTYSFVLDDFGSGLGCIVGFHPEHDPPSLTWECSGAWNGNTVICRGTGTQ